MEESESEFEEKEAIKVKDDMVLILKVGFGMALLMFIVTLIVSLF